MHAARLFGQIERPAFGFDERRKPGEQRLRGAPLIRDEVQCGDGLESRAQLGHAHLFRQQQARGRVRRLARAQRVLRLCALAAVGQLAQQHGQLFGVVCDGVEAEALQRDRVESVRRCVRTRGGGPAAGDEQRAGPHFDGMTERHAQLACVRSVCDFQQHEARRYAVVAKRRGRYRAVGARADGRRHARRAQHFEQRGRRIVFGCQEDNMHKSRDR